MAAPSNSSADASGSGEPSPPARGVLLDDDASQPGSPSLVPLFVFPLLVALVGVGIVGLFFYLTHEHRRFDDYLSSLRSRSDTERFQAAYDLASRLNSEGPAFIGEGGARNLAAIFEESAGEPPLRQFLAVALGRLGDASAVPALVGALKDADVDVRDSSVQALASIKSNETVAPLAELLTDESARVRASVAIALAAIGDASAIEPLRPIVSDGDPYVRLNAAMALARLGDRTGIPALRNGLDRSRIAEDMKLTRPEDQEGVVLFALQGLRDVPIDEVRPVVEGLAESDPSLRIRDAARALLSGESASTAKTKGLDGGAIEPEPGKPPR